MRCFEGLVSFRRYRVDQEIEIYNFRMVPELQINNRLDVLMSYIFVLLFLLCVVMNGVFWRFGEFSSIQARSGTRDLQF